MFLFLVQFQVLPFFETIRILRAPKGLDEGINFRKLTGPDKRTSPERIYNVTRLSRYYRFFAHTRHFLTFTTILDRLGITTDKK